MPTAAYATRMLNTAVQDVRGDAEGGATVTVTQPGGGLASLYADRLKAAPLPNPLRTDDLGQLDEVYGAVGGVHVLTIVVGQSTFTRYVPFLPDDADIARVLDVAASGAGAAAGLAAEQAARELGDENEASVRDNEIQALTSATTDVHGLAPGEHVGSQESAQRAAFTAQSAAQTYADAADAAVAAAQQAYTDAETARATAAEAQRVASALIGDPNGIALLQGGVFPSSVIPATSITHTFTAASQAAMLALPANQGDVCARVDLGVSFILQQTPAAVLGNWVQLNTPGGVVTVNGQSGVVTGMAEQADLVAEVARATAAESAETARATAAEAAKAATAYVDAQDAANLAAAQSKARSLAYLSIKDLGGVGDCREYPDATFPGPDPHLLVSASAPFAPDAVGKTVCVGVAVPWTLTMTGAPTGGSWLLTMTAPGANKGFAVPFLPPHTFSAASDAAMVALSAAAVGDVCVRSDLGVTFYLSASPPAVLGNWVQLNTPGGAAGFPPGATAAQVLAGIASLAPSGEDWGPLNVTVTGGPLGTAPLVVTFLAARAEQHWMLSADNSQLTGGASPQVTFAGPSSADIVTQFAGANTLYKIAPSGTITGGTWVIKVNGVPSAPIAWHAAAPATADSAIQTAVQAIAGVGSGNAIVGAGAIDGTSPVPITLAFIGALDNAHPTVEVDDTGLTGAGAALTVTVSGRPMLTTVASYLAPDRVMLTDPAAPSGPGVAGLPWFFGTDNSAVFATAQSSLAAAGGGTLRLDAAVGHYLVKRGAGAYAINVVADGVLIRGDGMKASGIRVAANQGSDTRIVVATGRKRVTLMDLSLHGSFGYQTRVGANYDQMHNVFLSSCYESMILRCEMEGAFGDAFYWFGSSGRNWLVNCDLHMNKRTSGHVQKFQMAAVIGNHFHDSPLDNMLKCEVDPPDTQQMNDGLIVTGNTFDGGYANNGCLVSGLAIDSKSRRLVIDGNIFRRLSIAVGIGIFADSVMVSGNAIDEAQLPIIATSYNTAYGYGGHVGVAVIGNVITNATSSLSTDRLIYVANATSAVVIGNQLNGAAFVTGIRLEHVADYVVAANLVNGVMPSASFAGITVTKCLFGVVQGNKVTAPGGTGVLIGDSASFPMDYCFVHGNLVTGAPQYGIDASATQVGSGAAGKVGFGVNMIPDATVAAVRAMTDAASAFPDLSRWSMGGVKVSTAAAAPSAAPFTAGKGLVINSGGFAVLGSPGAQYVRLGWALLTSGAWAELRCPTGT